MEICKWQIKLFVYSKRLMALSGLRVNVIMLPSSDFWVAN